MYLQVILSGSGAEAPPAAVIDLSVLPPAELSSCAQQLQVSP